MDKEFLDSARTFLDWTNFPSDYSQIIAKWALTFYDKYNAPIDKNLRNWFEHNKKRLKEDTLDLVESLLIELDQQYIDRPDFNTEYIVDSAVDFFKEQELKKLSNNINVLIDQGKIREAEVEVAEYHKIKKVTSEFYNPLNSKQVFHTLMDQKEGFFKLVGELGDFMGPMDRSWLVGISGAFKRGKSFFALEFYMQAVLSGFNAVFISLEMSKKAINSRIYSRLVPHVNDGWVINPVFDCLHNQLGSCSYPERTNRKTLMRNPKHKPSFHEVSGYKTCTYCVKNRPEDYKFATWHERFETLTNDFTPLKERIEKIDNYFYQKGRIGCYPRFSANIQDIRNDLSILESEEGFVPDVVIVDYADILKPEDNNLVGVEKEDRTWIALSQLSAELKALVISPTQITKDGQDAKNVKIKHSAKWVGKNGHVDAMYSMNQTDTERALGILRIGMMLHRHRDMNFNVCAVLQNLGIGQFYLDSKIFDNEIFDL